MMSNDAGKGDKPRPTDKEKFNSGYDRIWGEKVKYRPSKRKKKDGPEK